MTKNQAYFLNQRAAGVFEKLRQLQLEIFHPERNTIQAISDQGEEVFGLSQEAALQGLETGKLGFTMWINDSEDFFLSKCAGWIVGSFDGFTAAKEKDFLVKLRALGCEIAVLDENEEPPDCRGINVN